MSSDSSETVGRIIARHLLHSCLFCTHAMLYSIYPTTTKPSLQLRFKKKNIKYLFVSSAAKTLKRTGSNWSGNKSLLRILGIGDEDMAMISYWIASIDWSCLKFYYLIKVIFSVEIFVKLYFKTILFLWLWPQKQHYGVLKGNKRSDLFSFRTARCLLSLIWILLVMQPQCVGFFDASAVLLFLCSNPYT